MLVKLKGNHGEIGFQHGQQLRTEIEAVLDYYLALFALPSARLQSLAAEFKRVIGEQAPVYIDEIEAIAEGAAVAPWQIYCLNARSEIIAIAVKESLANKLGECTSLSFPANKILGQNWDWSQTLEPLMRVLQIEYDNGRSLLTMAEPGMLAKTGLNSDGLGVCLNILASPFKAVGLPIHLCLRMALDCSRYDEAKEKLLLSDQGKASHILLADAAGSAVGIEFDNSGHHLLHPDKDCIIHSNHYLAYPDKITQSPTTFPRYHYAKEKMAEDGVKDAASMKAFLLDKNGGEGSPFQPYHYYEQFNQSVNFGLVGTVMTVLMDLEKRKMEIKRAGEIDFKEYYLSN